MIGAIINIILDPIFIFGFDMGVAGAAIATVIGNLSSVIFYIVYLNGKNTMLSIRLKDFSIRDGIIPNVVGVGLPASLNNLLMSVANIILNKYLVSYGNVPVAAMGVASKANMLAVFLQLGIGMGIQPLVGYSFGAKNYERMKKIMHFAMICTTVIGVTVTTIYFFNTQSIVRIFIDDPEVIDYGITMLRALMVSSPFLGLLFCFNFTFQAMGEAIQSLILSISRQGLVFLPVVVIANALVGLDGIIFAQPIADLASLLMAAIMFKVIIGKIQKA